LQDQITPLILTRNEAPNIGRTLSKVGWAKDIVVLDSYSSDLTPEIARSFSQVRFFQREFDEHAKQWNFGLYETGIDTEWVLALDADYQVTQEFMAEISSLQVRPNIAGHSASFTYCVRGKQLRGTIYPSVTVSMSKTVIHNGSRLKEKSSL
jgi:glycosyltransferase involved in cell wall biosynthesis